MGPGPVHVTAHKKRPGEGNHRGAFLTTIADSEIAVDLSDIGQTEKWRLLKEAGLVASIAAIGRGRHNWSGERRKSTEPQHGKQKKEAHDGSPSLLQMGVI